MRYLSELYRFRDLLLLWTLREIQVRYKQSMLGAAWAVLQPLALTLVFSVVFSRVVRIDVGNIPYPAFAYTALVPWTFFASCLSFGVPSLVNNMNLVTKIYFPREVLPLASIGAALLDFLVASSILVCLLIVYRIGLTAHVLWVLPLLAIQLILTTGVTLLTSSVIVFFRDMRFVIPLLTQVWMYATPVIYPIDLVPERLRFLYMLNPMAGVIDGYRRALLLGEAPQAQALALSLSISLLLLVVGYTFFKRTEPLFADLI